MQQPCLICGRTPSDPHHLRFTQPRALGRAPTWGKVKDIRPRVSALGTASILDGKDASLTVHKPSSPPATEAV